MIIINNTNTNINTDQPAKSSLLTKLFNLLFPSSSILPPPKLSFPTLHLIPTILTIINLTCILRKTPQSILRILPPIIESPTTLNRRNNTKIVVHLILDHKTSPLSKTKGDSKPIQE